MKKRQKCRNMIIRNWKLQTVFMAALFTFILVVIRTRYLRPARNLKVIGYACHGECGGWADRQKGIISAFVLATILGKGFKIHMNHPCPLTYFLLPATSDLDWRIEPGELTKVEVSWIRRIDQESVKFAEDLLWYDDPVQYFSGDFVFITTNMEIVHILRRHRLAQGIRWLQEKTIPEIYRMVLTRLFAFMPGLQTMWDNFRHSLPAHTKLICAQIRAGGRGDSETFNTIMDLKGLASFLAPYNFSSSSSSSSSSSPPHRLLFTSDQSFMVDHVRRLFPARSLLVDIPGPITHVDHSKGSDVCAGMSRALVEQQVLSTCDVLVTSESGLGRVAAFLRGTDQDLYLFHDGTVVRTTRETPFPNRPAW